MVDLVRSELDLILARIKLAYDSANTDANVPVTGSAGIDASSSAGGSDQGDASDISAAQLVALLRGFGAERNDAKIDGSGNETIGARAGDDTFVFFAIGDAIDGGMPDFAPGDTIDMAMIDSHLGLEEYQELNLLSGPTFTDAGQLIFRHEQIADQAYTVLDGNVNEATGDTVGVEGARNSNSNTDDIIR